MIVRDQQIQADVSHLLQSLRERVRSYARQEGTAILLIWLGLTFMGFVVIDYFPVRFGGDELPRVARGLLLLSVLAGSGFVLYRWTLRRLWTSIPDRSAALLVERAYPGLQDRLVTSVELSTGEGIYGTQMLEETRQSLAERLPEISLDPIFNYRPLRRAAILAGLIGALVIACGCAAPQILKTAFQRLYLLSPQLYPRETLLEIVDFTNLQAVAARGSDFTVRVRADANRPSPPPRGCVIFYRTADGQRGRVNMSRMGAAREGFQYYVFDGKPFRGLLDDVSFDVRGGDMRLRGLRIRVVESPAISDVQLHCEFPKYTNLVPRTEPYRTGMQLPFGSRVTIDCRTNKRLQSALVGAAELASDSLQVTPTLSIEGESTRLRYTIERLDHGIHHEIALTDSDGISARRPQTIHLEPRADEAPQIEVWLTGIGSAVTPDAVLPFQGTIQDDFGVHEAWVELQRADQSPRKSLAVLTGEDRIEHRLDLRAWRQDSKEPYEIPLETRITVQFKASDYYDLANAPQIGQGDRFDLEVVSPEKLLALLEARELSLRRRFEQIVAELRQSRDSLSRIESDRTDKSSQPSSPNSLPGAEPEDARRATEGSPVPESDPSANGLRLLRVQRAWQDIQRSTQEVDGVTLSFLDICLELDNNRIDAVERQQRLREGIADPLRALAAGEMPDLTRKLHDLEGRLSRAQSLGDLPASSLRQADDILLALEEVLKKMLDLESYNELVDLVRGIIREEESLIEQTKTKQQDKALELLQGTEKP